MDANPANPSSTNQVQPSQPSPLPTSPTTSTQQPYTAQTTTQQVSPTQAAPLTTPSSQPTQSNTNTSTPSTQIAPQVTQATNQTEMPTGALLSQLGSRFLKNKLALGLAGAAFVLFIMGYTMGRASAPSCAASQSDLDTTIEEPILEETPQE